MAVAALSIAEDLEAVSVEEASEVVHSAEAVPEEGFRSEE
jgi:hypothetical protein